MSKGPLTRVQQRCASTRPVQIAKKRFVSGYAFRHTAANRNYRLQPFDHKQKAQPRERS